jgi:prephenate dehydrogenase
MSVLRCYRETNERDRESTVSTSVVRVPTRVHEEAARVAALRGQLPGNLIAEAWQEYIEKHREEFASDLEEAARLMRDGTAEQLAAFTSRFAPDRASAAAKRARSNTDQ